MATKIPMDPLDSLNNILNDLYGGMGQNPAATR